LASQGSAELYGRLIRIPSGQDGSRELRKEALDEIEPRAVLGRARRRFCAAAGASSTLDAWR
jgi:hypothetical protein